MRFIRSDLTVNPRGNVAVLVAIIVVVVLGTGIYFFGFHQTTDSSDSISQTNSIAPSPIATIQPDASKLSFQQIMDKYCKKTKSMKIEDLPVAISSEVKDKIVSKKDFQVSCVHETEPLSWSAMIYNDETYTTLTISDKQNRTSIIGIPANSTVIKNSSEGKLYLWHQAHFSDPKKDSIYALGEKQLTLSNGEIVYVRFSLHLLERSNPRYDQIKLNDVTTMNDKTVHTEIYNDLMNESSEQDRILLIEEILSGII